MVIPTAICCPFGILSCFGIPGNMWKICNWQCPCRKWLAFGLAWLCEMCSCKGDFHSSAESFRHYWAFENVLVRVQLLIGVLSCGIHRYYHIQIFKCSWKAESTFIYLSCLLFSLRISKDSILVVEGEIVAFLFFSFPFFGSHLLGIFLFLKFN